MVYSGFMEREARPTTTIRFTLDLHTKLQRLKEQTGAPIQHLVVKAVEEYLKKGSR